MAPTREVGAKKSSFSLQKNWIGGGSENKF